MIAIGSKSSYSKLRFEYSAASDREQKFQLRQKPKAMNNIRARCPPMLVFSPGFEGEQTYFNALTLANQRISPFIASNSKIYRGPKDTLKAQIDQIIKSICNFKKERNGPTERGFIIITNY
jgi:hypothetical protein